MASPAILSNFFEEHWWFLGVADTNDVIQKIEKRLNKTHTTTQKRTDNSFRNTKKHPEQWTQNYPQYFSGLSRAQFFRQPFSK